MTNEIITLGKENIKEKDIKLNTGDSNSAQLTTDRINGCLKSIIFISPVFTDLQIMSEYGYQIYKEMQHIGTHYFPLTISELSPNSHKRNFGAEEFYLNEKLIITVLSQKNTEVRVILRYTE